MRPFFNCIVFMRIMFFLLIFTFASPKIYSQDSSKLITANLSWIVTDFTNYASLAVYLEDTAGITSIAIQIDSVQDGNSLFNSQYELSSLPENSTVDETSILLDLGELPVETDYYVSVKVIYTDGNYAQTNLHSAK